MDRWSAPDAALSAQLERWKQAIWRWDRQFEATIDLEHVAVRTCWPSIPFDPAFDGYIDMPDA